MNNVFIGMPDYFRKKQRNNNKKIVIRPERIPDPAKCQ